MVTLHCRCHLKGTKGHRTIFSAPSSKLSCQRQPSGCMFTKNKKKIKESSALLRVCGQTSHIGQWKKKSIKLWHNRFVFLTVLGCHGDIFRTGRLPVFLTNGKAVAALSAPLYKARKGQVTVIRPSGLGLSIHGSQVRPYVYCFPCILRQAFLEELF